MTDPIPRLLPGIDRASPVPLLRQLYLALRAAILDGALAPGARLPPSRALAAGLGLARNTVVAAYDQLLAEGFATGRVGAGTFVARDMPEPPEAPPPAPARTKPAPAPAAPLPMPDLHGTAPFTTGRVLLDERSLVAWRRLTLRQFRRPDPRLLGYAAPQGSPALREAVAAYLRTARAVRCEPGQVLITAGAQQAIDLVLRVLLRPGDAVWMEDPGYPALRAALAAAGAQPVPVPVDAQGLDVAAGIDAAPAARLAYVTPSSQYPLGVQLSMARRQELLAWAKRSGAHVLEDDYDSEFRYAGRPLAALQGIDDGDRVIYVGSFSKVLFPGLRLGYAVVPPALLGPLLACRQAADWHPASLQEAVVADFLREGHFAAHLRRMRQRYRAARDTLVETLERAAGHLLTVEAPEQGLKLLARLRPGLHDVDIAAAAARQGILARALSPMYAAAPPVQGLVLGFSGHAPEALRRAAERLGRCA